MGYSRYEVHEKNPWFGSYYASTTIQHEALGDVKQNM
jgi:hypothetical protein